MASQRELDILIKAQDLASKEIKKVEKNFGAAGGALAAAGGAMAAGIGFAVNAAADFEAQLDAVASIAGSSASEQKKLEKVALDLGASTKYSAMEVAQGMELMAQNGFDSNQVIDSMAGVLDAAAASGMDLAAASDIVSGTLQGFQLKAGDAGKVADLLAMTANTSAAGMGDLGETFKYVAPVAAAAGYSIEEIAAATGIMGNNMIKGGQAGTALRGMIMRLQAPTGKAAEMMDQLGINVRNADGSMKSLPDILAEFEGGLKGVDKATADMALNTIIGQEAASGFTALLNAGSDALATYAGELENSGGSAAEVAAKQMDNFKGSIEEMGGAIETAAITIGQFFLPPLRNIVDGIANVVNWFNTLDSGTQALMAKLAAFGAIFGILAGGIMLVIPMLPTIAAGFAAIFSPIGILIMLISALVAAFIMDLGGIRTFIMEWVAGLGIDFNLLKTTVETIIQTFLTNIKMWWAEHGAAIMQIVQNAFSAIGKIIKAVIDAAVAIFNFAWPYIQQLIHAVMNNVVPFLIKMFGKISTFINEIIPPIVEIIKWAWQKVIQPVIQTTMNRIVPIIKSAWNLISGVIDGALDFIMGIIKFVLNLITGNWDAAWDGLVQALKGAWKLISSIFVDGFNFVKDLFGNVLGWLGDLFGDFVDVGKNLITGIWDGIKSMGSWIKDKVTGFLKKSLPDVVVKFLGIKSPSRMMAELGAFAAEGLMVGIQDMTKHVAKASEVMAGAAAAPVAGMSFGGESGWHPTGGSGGGYGSGGGNTVYVTFEQGSIVIYAEDADDVAEQFPENVGHIFRQI